MNKNIINHHDINIMKRGISNFKKHLYNCNCFDTNDANFIKKVNMYIKYIQIQTQWIN